MADGRKNNGGARKNSGRLKKDEVISLIEQMDAVSIPDKVWKALHDKVKDGDTQAIKTWLQYRYGMPKQVIDQNNTHTLNDFNLKDLLKFDE
jgi:hypothetical protein